MDQFDKLQQKLVDMWGEIGSDIDERVDEQHTVIVIPSLSVDIELTASAQQAYEERMLFLLFLLRKPGIRLIFVTSQRIHSNIIDYYLELIPGVVSFNAQKRLFLVSPEDGSPKPLSQKLLDRPHLIQQIRSLITDPNNTHLVPFNTTNIEREVAVALGVPMYAADPRFEAFGTKSGCRHVFESEAISHPLGEEDLFSKAALVEAISTIRSKRPDVQQVVVKLNEGVSGLGNELVDLSQLPEPGSSDEPTAIGNLIDNIRVNGFIEQMIKNGAIVEEFITGTEVHSPSVQLRLTPHGEVELLSTHDQMLGGSSGQSYLGAIFPANPEYSALIEQDALKIGERFAKEGILGRFAVDFVVVKQADGTWRQYAIEVNLRKGGTTAPFLILQYLTIGDYDGQVFRTAQGKPKYYVASDHVESDKYHVFTAMDLFDIVSNHQLHFNHATQTGIVMHLITGIGELGRVGVTAIGDSPQHAKQIYDNFVATLDREATLLLDG